MSTGVFAAVDLGASSGRVVVGRVGPGRLAVDEVHRFANEPVRVRDTLHWDVLWLYRNVLAGLRAAGQSAGALDGVGVDSWAVDYGLIDGAGTLLGNPVHYRDERTVGMIEKAFDTISPHELYATTGLQLLPFNTIYQLMAESGTARRRIADKLLLIPDLLAYWMTGTIGAEVTNASTTQLLDISGRKWAKPLAERVGIDSSLLPPLREPGEQIGDLSPTVLEATGLTGTVPLIAVGSHDTASAVVGVPMDGEHAAYISCGTWSLVGMELDAPVLTEASRAANFTNEAGVDDTIRYLRNIMGLWLLQESVRTWRAAGLNVTLDGLVREAALLPGLRSVIDPDDGFFLAPGDMPARIAARCQETGQPVPEGPAEAARCIFDSLALAHRRTLRRLGELTGQDIHTVHLVGGGARNRLLCQLTADACGLPVLAGPVEATALGNLLVQARARGVVHGSLARLRELLRETQTLQRYEPSDDSAAWAAVEEAVYGHGSS